MRIELNWFSFFVKKMSMRKITVSILKKNERSDLLNMDIEYII